MMIDVRWDLSNLPARSFFVPERQRFRNRPTSDFSLSEARLYRRASLFLLHDAPQQEGSVVGHRLKLQVGPA